MIIAVKATKVLFQRDEGFVGPRRERRPKGPDSENCIFCGTHLMVKKYRDAVKDHCHITGKYRSAAQNACNLKLRIKQQKIPIPVVFHNLKGYDAHLLMQAMSRANGQINCIPNNMEKYVSFSLGNPKFIDSLGFMMSSLDALVKGNVPEDMKITAHLHEDEEKRNLMLKKGIYPYEYIDDFARFEETETREKFYSKLSGKGITEKEYDHAQNVWKKFGCRNLGDYYDVYVKTDVVFENFRKVCMEKYGLDPAHYYTAPGLRWDDSRRAGAVHRPGHALIHRKRHAGRHLYGKQALRESQQPEGV